jgi:hypothetical protein
VNFSLPTLAFTPSMFTGIIPLFSLPIVFTVSARNPVVRSSVARSAIFPIRVHRPYALTTRIEQKTIRGGKRPQRKPPRWTNSCSSSQFVLTRAQCLRFQLTLSSYVRKRKRDCVWSLAVSDLSLLGCAQGCLKFCLILVRQRGFQNLPSRPLHLIKHFIRR